MIETDDHSIIRQIQLGNRDAFRLVIERYQRPVFNLALNMTGNEEDARDLVQDVFVKVYLNLEKVDPQYKFFSWLYRIAVNETVNFIRRKKPFVPLEEASLESDPGLDRTVEQKEKDRQLQKAILKLKPKHRLLLVMKYYSDMSYDQISVITGISETKVKSRLFEARQNLRDILTNRVR